MRQRSSLGSIQQLPDKRYKVTVTVGYTYDKNGKKKQRRHSRIVKSMREARELLRKYDKSVSTSYTLQEVIHMYFQDKNLKTSTRKTLESVFNTCLSNLYARNIGSIQGNDIDRMLDDMDAAETTMSTRCSKIHSLFLYAKRKGFIQDVPVFGNRGNVRHTNTMKILPTMEEVQNIIHTAIEKASYPYLYHMMLLIVSSGIRVGEACALRWKDIDFKNDTISIVATITRGQTNFEYSEHLKTESSTRIIPVDHSILEIINEIPRKSQFVFYGRKHSFVPPSTINRNVRKLFDELGYPKLRIYDLRHVHATQLLAHGVDIKSVAHRLGHASPMTTLNVYTHYVADNDRKAAELMGKLVLKKCLNTRKTE